MKEIKVSLHKSGQQQIAVNREHAVHLTTGSRFWNQWQEPPQTDPATPSFILYFPPWGVRLRASDRNRTTEIRKKWDENHVLIEGDDTLMICVSFFVLDNTVTLRASGRLPSITIGQLPLKDDKSLFVTAGKEEQGSFPRMIEELLNREVPKRLPLNQIRQLDRPTVCVSGNNWYGCAYLVALPTFLHE